MADDKFSDRLRQACKLSGIEWGQTAIAAALGVAKQTADRWMGESMPRADQIFAIADKLNVSARWLATGEGEMREAANEVPDLVRERTPLRRTGRPDTARVGIAKPHKKLGDLK